jgi:endothelin-converting enzyme
MAEPPPLADEGKRAAFHFVLLALSPSCSVESAPLLRGGENEPAEHPSLYQKMAEITSQPLTAISKLLLAVCLFLLLLSSIFVGLFAGAQHRINKIRHTPVPEPTTVSVTATQELPVTLTETELSTSVSATTIVSTTTAPAPIHTPDPKTVCEQVPYIMEGLANSHHLFSFRAPPQNALFLLLRSFRR